MSLFDLWTNSKTGRPEVWRLIFFTALGVVSTITTGWAFCQFLNVPEPPDPLEVPRLAFKVSVYCATLLFVLAVGGLWQLHSFSRRTQAFVENRGELRKGADPYFALRVGTFKELIESLAQDVDLAHLDAKFLDNGRRAGKSWASNMGKLFDEEARFGGHWASLSEDARIDWWEKADRDAGWGDYQIIPRAGEIVIRISHHELFVGAGDKIDGSKSGEALAYFLFGYCETVINGILVKGHVRFDAASVQLSERDCSCVFRRST